MCLQLLSCTRFETSPKISGLDLQKDITITLLSTLKLGSWKLLHNPPLAKIQITQQAQHIATGTWPICQKDNNACDRKKE